MTNIEHIGEAVLGAILLAPSECYYPLEHLKAEHFPNTKQGNTFKAITSLYKRNTTIDILTVTHELHKMGVLESVGGAYAVSQFTNRIASAGNIETHSVLLKEDFLKRELTTVYARAQYKFTEPGADPFQIYAETSKQVDDLFNGVVQGEEKRLDAIIEEVLTDCEEALVTGIKTGICSGIDILDRQTNGWRRCDLIILAGRPGMGKTAAAMQLAIAPAKQGIPVAVFSLEMSEKALAGRILSMISSVNVQEITTQNLSREKIDYIRNESLSITGIPLYIDQTPALSLTALRNKARRLKRLHKIELIIIDYLQLMGGADSKTNREQEISTISRGLKALAKELDLPIIALSQINREAEKRPDKKPMLSDLRESGAIEQDADMVIFCHRPAYYGFTIYQLGVNEIPAEGLFMFLISKFRNGRTGEVKARFIAENTLIVNHNS